MLFEFGNYLNTSLKNEEIIWRFIDDIVNGLIFLENLNIHYPQLRKRYTIFITQSNNFKLLNPFCFDEFLKECANVYCNPDKDPLEIL